MTESDTKQNDEARPSGLKILLLFLAGPLAIIFPFLFLYNGMIGDSIFLPQVARNVSQWCLLESIKRLDNPVFSSDGSTFVFSMSGTCKIGVYKIGTESLVYLAPPKEGAVYGATFHPQSDTIAFILARQVDNGAINYQLATSRIDGTGLKVLTSSDTRKSSPSYSFDGNKIIFVGSERCRAESVSYCWDDIYEFDFQSNTENRISNLQALDFSRTHFLPGNTKIVTSIVGDFHPEGQPAIQINAKYGRDRNIFLIDAGNSNDYEQLALDTPTASSPKPLPSGEIAFISRVNEYEKTKGSYIYDVFLWSNGASKRLTKSNRLIWDYAISDSGESVLLITEPKAGASKCEIILWNVIENAGRNLKCDGSASELPLTP